MENKSIITPPSRLSINLKELWHYRELFYFFSWRDIKVKYKQTYLGLGWVIIQPLLLMVLFTLVFKKLNLTAGTIRYEVFVLSGLLFWTFFNSSVSSASSSIIDQSNIIKKVYFPRLIIPVSALLVAFFELLMMLLIFTTFCIFFQQPILWQALYFVPLSVVLIFFASFGIGSFLSALSIKYRDFRYIVPFLLQLLFFSSQTIYSLRTIDKDWVRILLALNPLNAAIEIFRGSFAIEPDPRTVTIGIVTTIILTLMGLYYFKKTEAYFADLA